MTIEEIKKLIPKKRYELLELEIKVLVDEIAPVLEQLIPLEAKDREIKKRYFRLKVQPEWITDLTEELMKEKYKAIYDGFFREREEQDREILSDKSDIEQSVDGLSESEMAQVKNGQS